MACDSGAHGERPDDRQSRQRAEACERCVHDGKRAEDFDDDILDCPLLAWLAVLNVGPLCVRANIGAGR